MTQRQLNRLVSHATGESRRTIHRRGFSVADPLSVAYDPEPMKGPYPDDMPSDEYELPEDFDPCADGFLDWDRVQAGRQVAVA